MTLAMRHLPRACTRDQRATIARLAESRGSTVESCTRLWQGSALTHYTDGSAFLIATDGSCAVSTATA